MPGAISQWRRHLAVLAAATMLIVTGATPTVTASGPGRTPEAAPPHAPTSEAIFPKTLTDVDGNPIDVAKLAADGKLVVVTFKATWCPVCQEQLVRLRKLLPRLRSCGASFIVLAPGPAEDLRRIAHDSRFPYPFVEDRNLAIARAADLVLAPDQITPAIFILDEEREIAWLQRGRSGVYYGDGELLERLGCAPLGVA